MPIKLIDKLKRNNWRTRSRNITINHEVTKFTKTFRDNFITFIISAFGLVAALAWNDAIKAWIDIMFPEKTVPYKFYSAVLITVFTILVTYFISKFKE